MIEKKIEVNFTLSPQELAAEFCDFDQDQMAIFFNEIFENSQQEGWSLRDQIEAVVNSDKLSSGGKSTMIEIGQHPNRDESPA